MDTAEYSRWEDRGYSSPCYVWHGKVNVKGYPQPMNGILHRRLYEAHHGVTLPTEIVVHHLCEVKACLNVDHLEQMHVADHMKLHWCKIPDGGVAEIIEQARRAPWGQRYETHQRLADRYGVGVNTIRGIVYRRDRQQ